MIPFCGVYWRARHETDACVRHSVQGLAHGGSAHVRPLSPFPTSQCRCVLILPVREYPSGTYCHADCNLGCSVFTQVPRPPGPRRASLVAWERLFTSFSLPSPCLLTIWNCCVSSYLCFLVTERKKSCQKMSFSATK